MDEVEAISLSKTGESDAFRILVDRYGNVLFGTAYLMTRDRGLAEDMVQEAFLLAWRSLRSFREGTNFKAWVLRILVNRIMEERRKKRVLEAPFLQDAAASPNPGNPEQEAMSGEERRQVRRALDALGQESREAVVLRYYSDLTVPEIATALGWREGTVKSRIHRALKRLSELLRAEYIQDRHIRKVE